MGTVRYNYYRDVFKAVPMPFAFVDLDCFDANIHAILARLGRLPREKRLNLTWQTG